ncbi:MAG: hypothetical protein ACO200_10685 [Steroidobacteraceae bacterium]
MKAIITFEDHDDTVHVTGQVEAAPADMLPTGAQIMYAYMNSHIEQITADAQEWFRTELVLRAAAGKDEVIHGS